MILDSSRFRAKLKKRREQLEGRVRAALDEAARVAMAVAKGLAPGRIPETITARATSGFVAGVRVSSSWEKAKFVENSTAPHEIRPTNGKFLRFQMNGDTRYARVVNHPGTKGVHFMRAGREAGRLVLRKRLAQAIHGD